VRIAEELEPDAIVMDISMPGINGIGTTRIVHAKLPKTRIVVLSLHKSKRLVENVFKAGASGYVLKPNAVSDLVDALNAVARKETYVSPAVGSGTPLES